MFEEGRYFSAGRNVAAFDSKLGRFGMLICEDLWHMSLPYVLALDGAEAILCLTASPTRLSGDNNQFDNQIVNYEHHRTYARLLSTFVVFSNRVGFEDGINFWGGSDITAPGGEMIATARLQEEELIIAELQSAEVQRARRFSRHFLDERPELVMDILRRQAHQQ
jgi:NAD+ synthase (glutamine-hydrolysing)